MSPRTGRPKKENPNTIKYSISINAQLEKELEQYCKQNNITKSQAIRFGLELLLGKKKWDSSASGKLNYYPVRSHTKHTKALYGKSILP